MLYAERACALAGNERAPLLDTLAAAYAESGDFNRALKTAERALDLARSAGRADWANEIEGHIALYKRGQAFRAGP